MSHPRRFICPTSLESPAWVLGADEARHAMKALRLRLGDEFVLVDGRGGKVRARLTGLTGERLEAESAGAVERAPEPFLRPWLLVGAPDPPALDSVVEHAVELGAWRLVIARAERTPAPFAALERRRGRWETLVRSAGKQSGNPWFPEVLLFPSVGQAAAALPPSGFLLAQGAPAWAGTAPICGDVALVVGPEGDFTGGEVALLEGRGLVPVSFGPYTLRVETACLAALAALEAAGFRPLEKVQD